MNKQINIKNKEIGIKQTKALKMDKKQLLLSKDLKIEKQEPNENSKQENIKFDEYLGDGIIDKDKLIIGSFNVNGLRAIEKEQKLTNYINENEVDILILNELKIDEESLLQQKLIERYRKKYPYIFYNCCKPPLSGYSGVAILSKYKPQKYELDIEKHKDEGRLIMLQFQKFSLVGCYVPNSGQGLKRLDYRINEWDVDLREYLKGLQKEKQLVILGGDLNVAHEEIDIHNPKSNTKSAGFTKEERNSFSLLLLSGFVDTFRHLQKDKVQYSWWSYRGNQRAKGQGWRLDYFIINSSSISHLIDSTILDTVQGSDHCPIHLTISL